MSTDPNHLGVMDASYAAGRVRQRHLEWRYRVRAAFAARAFERRDGRPGGAPKVLELGAAEGRTLLALRERLGPDGVYDGIELSDELLAAAPPLPKGVTLHRGDVMALPEPIEAARYDLVAALALLEHLPDPLACVREAFRVLRPGGVFVATCPHPIWDEIAGHLRMVADEHHEDHMTGPKMERLARDAGFSDVEVSRFMWAPVGVLPYARLSVSPDRALDIDERLARSRLLSPTFVNQGLVAVKPG